MEDEAGVRNVTREFLEANGYTVLEAGEGSEALLICERHQSPIHIMVTDVAMPGLTGPEVAQRARLLRPAMKIRMLPCARQWFKMASLVLASKTKPSSGHWVLFLGTNLCRSNICLKP
ncbi:MAG: response regulator, partial [Planctomycetes bacterium]|nr:response regulator [Planctomycetota bacterium]